MMYASRPGENKHREPGCFASARVCQSPDRYLAAALGAAAASDGLGCPELLGDPWPNTASPGGHGGLGMRQGRWLGCDAAWGCSVPSSCQAGSDMAPSLSFLQGSHRLLLVERVPGDAPTAWADVAALLLLLLTLLLLLRPSRWLPSCTFSMCYININLRSHKFTAEPWG